MRAWLLVVLALTVLPSCITKQTFDLPDLTGLGDKTSGDVDVGTDTILDADATDEWVDPDSEVADVDQRDDTDVNDTEDVPDVADIKDIQPDEVSEVKVEICTPNCTGRVCGDDGCGGTCGECSDGVFCNGVELCDELGQCQNGEPPTCDDDNTCTTDSCSTVTDKCVHDGLPHDSEPCDDDDECTLDTWCMDGQCTGGTPRVCKDFDICTKDSCNKHQGCIFEKLTNSPCNDGDYCTEPDVCQNGVCAPGPVKQECMVPCGNGICEVGEGTLANPCPVDCGWCGDGVCGIKESENGTCPMDCEASCGNTKCEYGETAIGPPNTPPGKVWCPVDCHGCGDGTCGSGENFTNCFVDCPPPCGNSICDPGENPDPRTVSNPMGCPEDCKAGCGNGQCQSGENPQNCPADCAVCGDGVCAVVNGLENATNCPQDCLDPCGNGVCAGGETPANCAVDCGWCGDGVCGFHESFAVCPVDCSATCGNGVCTGTETEESCPQDCACMPKCHQKECGPDTCGGVCGVCVEPQTCDVETFLCVG